MLAGSRARRVTEAVRLYREGYAPRIVLSAGLSEPEEVELRRQGIRLPSDVEIARDVAVQLGVPASAVIVMPTAVDNTAQEADAIAPLVAQQHWTQLIVITDRPNSRRAGYAFRRIFKGRARIMVTCSRRDTFVPGRWWADRASVRSTMYEVPKLIAYYLGLKG